MSDSSEQEFLSDKEVSGPGPEAQLTVETRSGLKPAAGVPLSCHGVPLPISVQLEQVPARCVRRSCPPHSAPREEEPVNGNAWNLRGRPGTLLPDSRDAFVDVK